MPNDFIDARQGDLTDVTADFCIVGGGAAGLTLARELASTNKRVLVLEGGGLDIERENQDLFMGESVGLPYFPLDAARLRMLGGTTNHWQGFCYPMLRRDFDPIPGLELTKWPVEYDEMAPYVRRSNQMLGFAEDDFSPLTRLPEELHGLTDLGDVAEIRILRQLAPEYLRFGSFLGPELEKRGNVDLYLNANVTHIALDESGTRVDSVQVQTTNGHSFDVRSRFFILACHGIENARLLLDSNDVIDSGIGNQGDWVGRCFMEHPLLETGRAMNLRGSQFPPEFNILESASEAYWAVLTTPAGTEQSRECMQTMTFFQKKGPVRQLERAGYRFLQGLKKPYRPALLDDLLSVMDVLQESVDELVSGVHEFSIHHVIEQVPNPHSRVTLSEERDSLGCRRAVLDWQFTEVDYRSFHAAQEATANFLGASSIGRTSDPEVTAEAVNKGITAWFHHMGTTRMSDSPGEGVVDRDCRVHGVTNLYVAGSSIFCRGVYAPTMALIAFALRLSDHLKRLR